jgi:MinD-like ATPase involved in chromosome partitioning or flagellar assembly
VERTETGWGRAAEPPSRWRSLLDRARSGRPGANPVDPEEAYDAGPLSDAIRARRSAPAGEDSYSVPKQIRDAKLAGDAGGDYPSPEYRRLSYGAAEYAADADYVTDYDADADYVTDAGYPSDADYTASGRYTAPAIAAPRERQPSGTGDPLDRYVDVLRQDLRGPRVLAFANPKGGVHKTTATVLAAATIGAVRGQGVIAWDDNELRGTLGLRAGSARHARTIRHLVRDLSAVEANTGYQLRERLDDYLRHASDGSFDVLAGEENPRFAQRLDPYTVRRVLELLRRTHDIICVDTGNNVESPNWQTVLQDADQLIVTTVPREDAAFTADWMLDLLDEAGMQDLVKTAVTVMSCPTPRPNPLIEDLSAHFASRTRAVVVVPYDPALESGSLIEYPDLSDATKQAWFRASAVIMDEYAR